MRERPDPDDDEQPPGEEFEACYDPYDDLSEYPEEHVPPTEHGCHQEGCSAIIPWEEAHCLVHASGEGRVRQLGVIRASGRIELRGATVESGWFEELLDEITPRRSAWSGLRGISRLSSLDLDGANLPGGLQLTDMAVERMSARFTHWGGALEVGSCDIGMLDLAEATFTTRDPLRVAPVKLLVLRKAGFDEWMSLYLATEIVDLGEARLRGGGSLTLAGSRLWLDGCQLGAPSSVTGERGARLVSLRGTNVGDLELRDVDLSACRLIGARDLERVRVHPSAFAATEWARLGWTLHTLRRPWTLTRRRLLFEELEWRMPAGPWTPARMAAIEDSRTRGPDRSRTEPTPAELTEVYRALRTGRESAGDEPGAADFYYGEMEMRRHAFASRGQARATPRAERAILWAYWALSGYGLRASRALAALGIVLVTGAVLFAHGGFAHAHPPSACLQDRSSPIGALCLEMAAAAHPSAILFSLESAASLLHQPTAKLTVAGETEQFVLRILSPVLIGFALLALRGRVKR